MNYNVMLERGVWLAPWGGDPGRTLIRKSATIFDSLTAAEIALEKARKHRPFPFASIDPTEDKTL